MQQVQMELTIGVRPILLVNQLTSDFVERAKEIQEKDPKNQAVNLKFQKFASNSSLVIARSFVDFLNSKGIYCSTDLPVNETFKYANRIGFFEDFTGNTITKTQHKPNGRFMEIELITSQDTQVSGKVSDSLRQYANRDDVYISEEALEILTYSVGELISNVRRHAGFTGRVSFQYYKHAGLNDITVCDCGIGIAESLKAGGYEGSEVELLKQSIKKSVTSSRIHASYSERSPGVGLYNICRIAEMNEKAHVFIATGNMVMTVNKEYPIDNPGIKYMEGYYPGTIVLARVPNNVQLDLSGVLSEHLKDTVPFF